MQQEISHHMETLEEIYLQENYRQFHDIMITLALKDKYNCADLLSDANYHSNRHGQNNPLFRLHEACYHKCEIPKAPAPEDSHDWKVLLQKILGSSSEKKKKKKTKEEEEEEARLIKESYQHVEEKAIDDFVSLCSLAQQPGNKQAEHLVETFLRDLYQSDLASHIMFLLMHVDKPCLRQFAQTKLGVSNAAWFCTVDIVVRKTDDKLVHGNTGHYTIFTRSKDGSEQPLHFTHQPSTVYYLMFLICRCQTHRLLPHFEFRHNMYAFFKIYRLVYDESDAAIHEKFKKLLYREDQFGQLRAGRLHEIVYDIRQQLEQRFNEYGENYQPYAIGAREELTVGAEHIYFEGEAQQMLEIDFV